MSTTVVNQVGKIPVQNIWLLMAYAAEFSHLDSKTKSAFIDNSDDLPDLVVDLLCKSAERRLRTGLSAGYVDRKADLPRVRGRINHLRSARHLLLSRGRVACEFTELSNDTPRNQYVRYALSKMSGRVTDRSLARRARSIVRSFDELGVSNVIPTPVELSRDKLGRHDLADKEMIELAKIALELAIPTEEIGATQHYQPDKTERWVRKLFEKAIAGFYRVNSAESGYKVRTGTPFYWPYTEATDGLSEILPSMRADIIIDHIENDQRLVIDTKFNEITTAGYMRKETLRSGYLYQIYAYLRTQEKETDSASLTSTGMLLHPSVGQSVYEALTMQGHRVVFATVDLTQSATDIKQELRELLSCAQEHNGGTQTASI